MGAGEGSVADVRVRRRRGIHAIVQRASKHLVEQIAACGKGVVMTMGKGGVGKTTIAARIATELAQAATT